MCYIELHEVLKIDVVVSIRCYVDIPVEEWTAKCDKLNLEAKGKTSTEARENLVKMIEQQRFKPCE